MSTESRRPVDRWYPPRSNPLASRSLPSILQGFHGGPLALAEPAVAPRRNGQPAARRGDGRALGAAVVRGDDPPLRGWGDFRQDRRERARPRCVHHPADQPAGGEPPGAVVPDRRRATGERGADHGGAAVLRLRAPGPPGPASGGPPRTWPRS